MDISQVPWAQLTMQAPTRPSSLESLFILNVYTWAAFSPDVQVEGHAPLAADAVVPLGRRGVAAGVAVLGPGLVAPDAGHRGQALAVVPHAVLPGGLAPWRGSGHVPCAAGGDCACVWGVEGTWFAARRCAPGSLLARPWLLRHDQAMVCVHDRRTGAQVLGAEDTCLAAGQGHSCHRSPRNSSTPGPWTGRD